MEIREVDMNTAVSFSKDSEDCQLSLPVISSTGIESDIGNENLVESSKQENIFCCLSGLYAEILLVVTGVSVLYEILHPDLSLFYIHEYIFLYIFGIGILLLIGAYAKQCCGYSNHSSQGEDNNFRCPKSTRQRQGFAISSYYKIGGFVFGSIVVLVTSLEIFSIFVSPKHCLGTVSAVSSILRCVFISLQICFLKNPNEVISRFAGLRDFALMHLFAANGATWIRHFLWESAMNWEYAFHLKHNSSVKWSKNMFNFTVHSLESDSMAEDAVNHYTNHVVHYTSNCWWRLQKVEEKMDVLSVTYCLQQSPIGYFWGQTSHFLYPLMVQYYFIITSILYILWLNFNVKHKYCISIPSSKSKQTEICSQSTKGFFLGFIICIMTIIIVIIFFSVKKNLDMILSLVYLIIFSSSFLASLVGLSQIKKMLTWNSSKDIYFIKLFQNIGIFALLIYGTSGLICEGISEDKSVILTLSTIGMLVHGCTQYVFIIQVSRKKVDVSNIHKKAGRQTVAFLILSNLSLWLLDCFVNGYKQPTDLSFGKPLWPVITRCMLPIVAFHRFHSIVTLVEVWSCTYK